MSAAVMVGHHQIDTALHQVGNLVPSGDAVVDRHHQRRRALRHHGSERVLADAVTLFEPMGDERVDVRAKLAQRLGERQVEVMPSTSKSPKTAMDSRSSIARWTRSATSRMPGMINGSHQSRSSEGVRRRSTLVHGRNTASGHDAATSGATCRPSASCFSIAGSLFESPSEAWS